MRTKLDMQHFISECDKRGWWRGVDKNDGRDWHELYCCELCETKEHPMPHAYICGTGPNREAAIADAAKQLGMFLWESNAK